MTCKKYYLRFFLLLNCRFFSSLIQFNEAAEILYCSLIFWPRILSYLHTDSCCGWLLHRHSKFIRNCICTSIEQGQARVGEKICAQTSSSVRPAAQPRSVNKKLSTVHCVLCTTFYLKAERRKGTRPTQTVPKIDKLQNKSTPTPTVSKLLEGGLPWRHRRLWVKRKEEENGR